MALCIPSYFFHPQQCLLTFQYTDQITLSIIWGSMLGYGFRHLTYCSVATRLTGLSIKAALAVLGDMRMPLPTTTLSPFAHFVLINSTLSSIFSPSSMRAEPTSNHCDSIGVKNDFVLQYTLHNWLLQGWIEALVFLRYRLASQLHRVRVRWHLDAI
jgi:hypothetical protein